jgi:hypothetical protein
MVIQFHCWIYGSCADFEIAFTTKFGDEKNPTTLFLLLSTKFGDEKTPTTLFLLLSRIKIDPNE